MNRRINSSNNNNNNNSSLKHSKSLADTTIGTVSTDKESEQTITTTSKEETRDVKNDLTEQVSKDTARVPQNQENFSNEIVSKAHQHGFNETNHQTIATTTTKDTGVKQHEITGNLVNHTISLVLYLLKNE